MKSSSKPRIAFVGSGGAVKGVAHLGVLRAMEELGIEADLYVGSSVGAVAGAFSAQGFRADEMVDWLRPFWRRHGDRPLTPWHFLGLPTSEQWLRPGYLTSGLLSADRLERFIAERLPCNDFRSIKRPVYLSACDIDGWGRVVFGPGHRDDVPISQALAASCCVPVVFRPYEIGGRYYVDGEIVRTLSLDVAVEAGADVVIVSNVYRPAVREQGAASIALSGGFAVARQALNYLLFEKEKRGIDLVQRQHPHVHVLNVSANLGAYPFNGGLHVRSILTRSYREALKVMAAAKQRGVFEVRSNVRAVGKA